MSILDDIVNAAGSGFSAVGNAFGGATGQQALGAAKKIFSAASDDNIDPLASVGAPKFSLMDVLNAPASAVQQIPGEQSLPGPVRSGLESAAYAIPAIAAALPTGGASLADLGPAAARLGIMGLGGYGAQQLAKQAGAGQGGQSLAGIGGQVLGDVLTRHIGPFAPGVVEGDIHPPGTQATWHAPDGDIPVTLTGHLGEQGGEHYYSIEGSRTGVPESQLTVNPAPAAPPAGGPVPPPAGGVASAQAAPAGAVPESPAQRAQRIASGVLNGRAGQIASDAGYEHLVNWEVPGERLTPQSYRALSTPAYTGGRNFYREAGSQAAQDFEPQAAAFYDQQGNRVGFRNADGTEALYAPDGSVTHSRPGTAEQLGYVEGAGPQNAPSGNNQTAYDRAAATADRIVGGQGFGAPNGRSFEDYAIRDSNAGRQWSETPPRDAGPARPTGVGNGAGNSNGQGGGVGNGGRPMGGGPVEPMPDESGIHYAGRALVDAITLPTRGLTFLHAPLRQVPLMLGETVFRGPEAASRSIGNFFRVLGGKSLPEVQAELHDLPYGGLRDDGRGALNWMANGKQPLPPTFVTRAADRIPFLKRFGDAGQAMVQTFRVMVYNSDAERLAKLGADTEDFKASWGAVSAATGHGKAFGPMPTGSSAIVFSPQALLGRFLTPFKVFIGTGAPLPWAAGSRAVAMRQMLSIAGSIAIADGIGQALGAKLTLGDFNNSPWTNNFPGNAGPINKLLGLTGVNTRQVNSRLGKAMFGTTGVDPSFGYGPLLRMFGNAALAINDNDQKALVGHVAQYMSGELGPTLSVAIDAMLGQKVWNGQAFHLSDLKTQNELINRFAPIAAASIWNAAHTPTGNVPAAALSVLGIGTDTTQPSAHFERVAPNGNWRDYNRYSEAVDRLAPYRDMQQEAGDVAWQMAIRQHPEWQQYDGLNGSKRFDGLAEALAAPPAEGGAGMAPDAAYKLMQHLAGPYFGFQSYAEQRYLNEHPELIPILKQWQYAVPRGVS